jgi:glycosyltransferase involved in cell wall biosynthesis
MPMLYSLMDVLVLPSLFEGVPRAVMEASAMGVPVVVTDVKGNREAVKEGENGLLVPLGDVQALAGAVSRVLTDSALAAQLANGGRQLTLSKFDERTVFETVRNEYACLLKEKGFRPPEPALH